MKYKNSKLFNHIGRISFSRILNIKNKNQIVLAKYIYIYIHIWQRSDGNYAARL